MVLFFSATGNTEFIARQLEDVAEAIEYGIISQTKEKYRFAKYAHVVQKLETT